MEDAALHGCVPVLIMDHTLGPWESQLDYSKFSLRCERLCVLKEGLCLAGQPAIWFNTKKKGLPALCPGFGHRPCLDA